jgi:uncharacterized protein
MLREKLTSTYTGFIIIANVLAFLIFSIVVGMIKQPTLITISYIAIQPGLILAGKHLWTFLTHMFMHASLTHLFVNMVSLMFLGSFVEKLIGKKRFLWVYFGGGISAALLFIIVAGITGIDINTFAVGASGAIFALGGLLAVLTPRLPVLVFFVLPMPMWGAMIFLLGVMWLMSITLSIPIGNIAHLGGLIMGAGYGLYLKKKYPRKTKMISRYFS